MVYFVKKIPGGSIKSFSRFVSKCGWLFQIKLECVAKPSLMAARPSKLSKRRSYTFRHYWTISLTFCGHDNVPNNESVFVGISESWPHCTDRISRYPHTRCAVTSSVTWRRQSHTLCELRYERPKKSIEWVEILVLFFAVCGPKFTKFGIHVGEWLRCPTPFSDRRYLVPVRRYSRSNREIRNFDVFGPPNFLGEGPPKFLTHI